ncbi:MAG: PorT family protein [Bacteroidales bacterium]|nr:PorT family protein [Bacteroidales bacterium]
MKFLKSNSFIFILIPILYLFPKTTEGQIGLKSGTTFSSFSYSDETINPNLGYDIDLRPYLGYDIEWVQLGDQKPVFGPFIGVYYNYPFAKRLSLRPELSFTQKGVNFSQRDYERIIYTVKISYLEIPLSVGCQYIEKEKFISELYLGGYGAIKINAVKKVASHNSEVEKTQLKSVENFETGLHLGLNFKYKIFEKFILLDVRFFNGLSNIFYMPEDQVKLYYTTPKTKNTGLNLTLGYEF